MGITKMINSSCMHVHATSSSNQVCARLSSGDARYAPVLELVASVALLHGTADVWVTSSKSFASTSLKMYLDSTACVWGSGEAVHFWSTRASPIPYGAQVAPGRDGNMGRDPVVK